MNIVIFSDTFYPEVNGVATSSKNLYDVLKSKGHKVYIITSNPFTNKVIVEDDVIRIPGIKMPFLYDYVLTGIYSNKVMEFLKKLKIDVVHIQCDLFVSQFGWIAVDKLKIPSVYTYHTMYEDYTHYATKGKIDRFAKWAVREYSQNIAFKSTEIITPSKKTKDYLRRSGCLSYINIVPTGIDLKLFKTYKLQDKLKNDILKKYNMGSDDKVFLSLGRIAPEKSVDVIMQFFIKYIKETKAKNFHLLVVGDGPSKAKLEVISNENNMSKYIHFVGKVDPKDVIIYYSIAQYFLSASVSESQGLTYLEAMANNKIVIAKYDSNLTELIEHDYNGFFFNDYHSFKNVLTKVLNLSPTIINEMKKSMDKTVDNFSIDLFYERIIEVYKRAIRRKW